MEVTNAKSRLCALLLKLSAAVLLLSIISYSCPTLFGFFLGVLFTLCAETYGLYWFMLTDSELAVRLASFYVPPSPSCSAKSAFSPLPSSSGSSSAPTPSPTMARLLLLKEEGLSPLGLTPMHE